MLVRMMQMEKIVKIEMKLGFVTSWKMLCRKNVRKGTVATLRDRQTTPFSITSKSLRDKLRTMPYPGSIKKNAVPNAASRNFGMGMAIRKSVAMISSAALTTKISWLSHLTIVETFNFRKTSKLPP